MTTCRACVGRAGAEPAADPAVGTALLLRVWREGDLRARLIGVDGGHRTVATAQGIDAICDAVRAWLTRQ